MSEISDQYQALRAESTELRARLTEAEETLAAIRNGEVDALVVGEHIYMLTSADAASNRLRGEALAYVNDAVIAVDNDFRVTWLNVAAEQQYGVRAADVLGRPLQEVYECHWLQPEDEAASHQSLQETGHWRGENLHITHSGKEIYVESSVNVLRDYEGVATGLLAVIRDITLRKVAELTQAKLSAIIESSADAIYIYDFDGTILSWNKSAEELYGYTAAEIIGNNINILLPPDRKVEAKQIVIAAIKRGEVIKNLETVRLRRDGSCFEALLTASPVRDAAGQPIAISIIVRDITERKQIEAERERLLAQERQARAEAEAATRAKDEFVSVVSHELRNPLNSILGYTRVARANLDDTAKVARSLEIVERNARVQQQLIEDLLDIARIISGKLQIEPRPVDLVSVLEAALDVVRPAADAKGITLITDYAQEPQLLNADPRRLQQIIWNLLQNAVKFTPAGGRVELRMGKILKDEGGRMKDESKTGDASLHPSSFIPHPSEYVEIIVNDTGQGIAPEFLPSIFDRFSQNDISRTRRHGGLGLGLALARQLTELHGGTIAAASPGVGQGATFTVTLPLRAPLGEEHLMPPRAIAEVHTSLAAIPLDDLPRLDGTRVLVVDDEEAARRLLSDTLSEFGAVVTTAKSGPDARAVLADAAFDVLICDIGMPEEDGYTVLSRIRAFENQRGVPLSQCLPAIALTGLARAEDRLQALSAGFQMHVAKPVELAELIMVIVSVIGNRRKGAT